jgi:hypothetical protein
MFFFQSMFQTVYSGITGSMTLTFVQGISESILLLALLLALYEAYARAGDTRALGVAGLRYLAMGIIISQYPNVFRAVNDAFNNVAATIAPTDVLTNYRAQVAGYLASPAGDSAWWNLVAGGAAGVVSVLFQLVAVFIFPITYVLFAFFYSMYGALLYVFGPLVLALYPVFGIGQLARTYMVNLLIWNAWGIVYAVMSQMLTILNADSLTSILTAQNFGGAFQGASEMVLISLSSILLSLMIALIPFIAKRIVSGDVGSTLFAVVGVAGAALQTAAVAIAGAMSGAGGGGGGDKGPDGPGGGDHIHKGDSNRPPKPPDYKGPDDGDEGGGPGDQEDSSRPPKGPDDDGQIRRSSGGQAAASAGGGVSVREAPAAKAAGGGGGGGGGYPPDHSGGGRRVQSHHPRPYGLYYIPYGLAWAAGRTVRAVNDLFKSRDS